MVFTKAEISEDWTSYWTPNLVVGVWNFAFGRAKEEATQSVTCQTCGIRWPLWFDASKCYFELVDKSANSEVAIDDYT